MDLHKLTKAHYDAPMLTTARRARIVDSKGDHWDEEEQIIAEDVWIGERGRAVDLRQFLRAVCGILKGRIARGTEARYDGIIMPLCEDEQIAIVMDIR